MITRKQHQTHQILDPDNLMFAFIRALATPRTTVSYGRCRCKVGLLPPTVKSN